VSSGEGEERMKEGAKDGNPSLSGFSPRSRFITVLLCPADLSSFLIILPSASAANLHPRDR